MVVYYKCSNKKCGYVLPVEIEHCPRCSSYMEEKYDG